MQKNHVPIFCQQDLNENDNEIFIIKKYYNKDDNLFYVIREDLYSDSQREETYSSFDSFYTAVNKNLEDANLINYDFKDCDIKKYNLKNAFISSETMEKVGKYTTRFENLIRKNNYPILPNYTSQNIINYEQNDTFLPNIIDIDCKNDSCICYISDLHLDEKILKKFPNKVNKYELLDFLLTFVKNIASNIPQGASSIIIAGDVSHNFEIFKLFFKSYRQHISLKTFFILGNHELWDIDLINRENDIEKIIKKYKTFLSSLEPSITLLENELYFFNSKKSVSADEILEYDNNKIRKLFKTNAFAIFGGIGYAGLNKEFNASIGLYRNAPINRIEEKNRSKIVESIHNKLKTCIPDKKVFFVTHMPKEDWTTENYAENWIYINGHTHKNYFCNTNEKHIYADNQVGYEKTSFGLKYIPCSENYDFFVDYKDGIYEITKKDYLCFNKGLQIYLEFNSKFEKLYMIKRNNTYCFLLKKYNCQQLRLLNGGQPRNVGDHDLQYFYDNLPKYSDSIKQYLIKYSNFQQSISKTIKSFGGNGNIHGCIIDIDFYNHLYINPIDATITPYYATSTTSKYVYKDVLSLLKYRNKVLYQNCVKLLNTPEFSQNQLICGNFGDDNNPEYVSDVRIYNISNKIKSLQYTTNFNVVRTWNDSVVNNNSDTNAKFFLTNILELKNKN